MARPFVAGAEREAIEPARTEPATALRAEPAVELRSIDDFIDRSTRSATPVSPASTVDDFPSEFDEESTELPPVEHFLDPLPRVGDFAPESSNPFDELPVGAQGDDAPGDPPSGGLAAEWANTDWQQYDWRSLAALGEGGESAASNAWASTDWDATGPRSERPTDARPTAAQAIASALDQIAQRIRSGELAVGGATDPATLSATLAAILGVRT